MSDESELTGQYGKILEDMQEGDPAVVLRDSEGNLGFRRLTAEDFFDGLGPTAKAAEARVTLFGTDFDLEGLEKTLDAMHSFLILDEIPHDKKSRAISILKMISDLRKNIMLCKPLP